jgi:glucuronate isomerase
MSIGSVEDFLAAIERRRSFFKQHGAAATDHAARTPHAEVLSAEALRGMFDRGRRGEATEADAARFGGHMLVEMARMSREDGLAMQLHVGSLRNHNRPVHERFGIDMGADIPIATDWTRGLRTILNRHGNDAEFTLIVFTLDESTYARELAPLAGHYPALWLGAPWWFFDSVLGMERYLDAVVETAGMYNLAGFNDDTRAFASIPTRHDVWRRTSCNWLAEKVERGLIDGDHAPELARWLAYEAPRQAYGLTGS